MLKMIRSVLTIGLLSTALLGCGHKPQKPDVSIPDTTVIAVDTSTQRQPPTELLTCSRRPPGFRETEDAVARIKEPERSALNRVVEAFRLNADQLDRFINWEKPGTCK